MAQLKPEVNLVSCLSHMEWSMLTYKSRDYKNSKKDYNKQNFQFIPATWVISRGTTTIKIKFKGSAGTNTTPDMNDVNCWNVRTGSKLAGCSSELMLVLPVLLICKLETYLKASREEINFVIWTSQFYLHNSAFSSSTMSVCCTSTFTPSPSLHNNQIGSYQQFDTLLPKKKHDKQT